MAAGKKYKYRWTKHYKASAQDVGDWLASLPDCSTEAIVLAAQDPESPAHHIIWGIDDKEAAWQFRLIRARTMKNSLRVQVIDAKGKIETVPAFISTVDRTSYVLTLEATADELSAAEMDCWRQMQRFRQRYNSLKFAGDVVAAIARTEQRAVRARKKKRRGR